MSVRIIVRGECCYFWWNSPHRSVVFAKYLYTTCVAASRPPRCARVTIIGQCTKRLTEHKMTLWYYYLVPYMNSFIDITIYIPIKAYNPKLTPLWWWTHTVQVIYQNYTLFQFQPIWLSFNDKGLAKFNQIKCASVHSFVCNSHFIIAANSMQQSFT